MWFLGSTTNQVGANGAYDAATLAAGRGDTYRLGAGGDTLFFGTNGNANVLTDVDAANRRQPDRRCADDRPEQRHPDRRQPARVVLLRTKTTPAPPSVNR